VLAVEPSTVYRRKRDLIRFSEEGNTQIGLIVNPCNHLIGFKFGNDFFQSPLLKANCRQLTTHLGVPFGHAVASRFFYSIAFHKKELQQ
jgi:hypothetical protein